MKPASQPTGEAAFTVFTCLLAGAVLSTLFCGWTPVLVVSGGLVAAAVVAKAFR